MKNFNNLPAFRGIKQVITKDQSTQDIMNEVFRAHFVFKKDYDLLLDYFSAVDPVKLAQQVFTFCKDNIKYKIETENLQSTRSPAGILYLRNGDCKHFSGFVAGILDAARRMYKQKFQLYYRFASYDLLDDMPAHVFVILKVDGKEYWIDPVLKHFNTRTPYPTFFTDKKIPMALVRLSGLTQPQDFPPNFIPQKINRRAIQGTQPVNLYSKVAEQLGTQLNVITANIPFVALAQGLVTKFFGQGGISDWLTPSGILNELQGALFGRMYRGGQYWLGEKFKYYVLGIDIHTRDADVVTNEAVGTAITTFSVGFGVPIDDYQDILNLQKGADTYLQRYELLGVNRADVNADAVARAVRLKQMYFPTEAEGNFKPTGVAPQKWDLNNFNKISYAAPIPDFTKPYPEMWKNTYSGKIPQGEVKNGIVIAGQAAGAAGSFPLSTALIIGAVVVGGYFLLRKKR